MNSEGYRYCNLDPLFWLYTVALLCKPATIKEQLRHIQKQNRQKCFTLHNSYMN